MGGRGHARHAVALGAVAGGREKRAGGLRHARLVPPSAMLHNPPMAGAMGDAEKTDAPAGAWRAGLRAAPRAIVDYALPPRCPGFGVILRHHPHFSLPRRSSRPFLRWP